MKVVLPVLIALTEHLSGEKGAGLLSILLRQHSEAWPPCSRVSSPGSFLRLASFPSPAWSLCCVWLHVKMWAQNQADLLVGSKGIKPFGLCPGVSHGKEIAVGYSTGKGFLGEAERLKILELQESVESKASGRGIVKTQRLCCEVV